MRLINRVKNLLLSPKTEWEVISGESLSGMPLIFSYLLPLAIAAALATFLGFALWAGPFFGMHYGILSAIILLIELVAGIYINALVTDALAPSFASQKNLDRSIQLVVYAATPFYIGSLLNLIPSIGWLGSLAGMIYSVYLFYLGIPVLKKTPADKVPIYLIAIVLALIVIGWILQTILVKLFLVSYAEGALRLIN